MRPDSYHTRSPDSMDLYAEEGSNMAVNKVNVSEKALSLVAIILASVSISLSIFFYEQAVRAERETRMLQYYLLELDAKVIAAGIKKPEEAISRKQERAP